MAYVFNFPYAHIINQSQQDFSGELLDTSFKKCYC